MKLGTVVKFPGHEVLTRWNESGAVGRYELIRLPDWHGLREIVFISPVINRQNRGQAWTRRGRYRIQQSHIVTRRIGFEAVYRAVSRIGNDHEVARFIKSQLDGVQRTIADLIELTGGSRPAVNGLPSSIHEIKIARCVHSSAGDAEETARKFFHFRALCQNRRRWFRSRSRCIPRNGQPSKFPLSQFDVVGRIKQGVVKRHLAVAVAVYIAKMYVLRIGNFDRVGERLVATDYAIHMQVCDGDITRILNLQRQRETTFAPLLFGLQGVDSPIGHMMQYDLVPHMVLAR